MMVLCCQGWGTRFIYLAWAFWWLDAVLSAATCISMPFIVMHRHRPGLENITAALLLPIVPAVVAAASGGLLAEVLPDRGHAMTTVIASYVLWGIGESFSACVLALYFHRLTIHSIPPREVIVSVFLPIGPLGQGGYGIQQLGKVAMELLPETAAFASLGVRAGEVLYVLGVFLGIMMWGFALVWLSFALISIATMHNFPFNMGWWGFTFPLGVLATCMNALAENLDSEFFKVSTMVSRKLLGWPRIQLTCPDPLPLGAAPVGCRGHEDHQACHYRRDVPCAVSKGLEGKVAGCGRRQTSLGGSRFLSQGDALFPLRTYLLFLGALGLVAFQQRALK